MSAIWLHRCRCWIIRCDLCAWKQRHSYSKVIEEKSCARIFIQKKWKAFKCTKYGAIFSTRATRRFGITLISLRHLIAMNTPVANFNGEIYNALTDTNRIMGVVTPQAESENCWTALEVLRDKEPENLEEQAISLVRKIFTTSSSRAIRRNNEGRSAANYQHLSFAACQFVTLTITTNWLWYVPRDSGGGYAEWVEAMLGHKNIEVRVECSSRKDDTWIVNLQKIVFWNDWWVLRLWTRHIKNTVRSDFLKRSVDVENYQGDAVVKTYQTASAATLMSSSISISSLYAAKAVVTRGILRRLEGRAQALIIQWIIKSTMTCTAQYEISTDRSAKWFSEDALDSIVITICIS